MVGRSGAPDGPACVPDGSFGGEKTGFVASAWHSPVANAIVRSVFVLEYRWLVFRVSVVLGWAGIPGWGVGPGEELFTTLNWDVNNG